MNDSDDFYGASLAWYSPAATAFLGFMAVTSNAILLWLAATTPRIRVVACNWIVISLALSDSLFGQVQAFWSPITYSTCYQLACNSLPAICGALNTVAVSTASLFPLIIALHRYLKITEATAEFTRRRLVSKWAIFFTILTVWTVAVIGAFAFYHIGLFGESGDGYYGIKWSFNSNLLFINSLIYSSATVLCRIGTSLVYVRLHRYVTAHKSAAPRPPLRRASPYKAYDVDEVLENKLGKSARMGIMKMVSLATFIPAASAQRRSSSINYAQLIDGSDRLDTRALMKMIKLATFIPLTTESVMLLWKAMQILSGQRPSIAVLRAFSFLLFVPPMCNPWLSVIILRPFRQAFQRRIWSTLFRCSRNIVSVQNEL